MRALRLQSIAAFSLVEVTVALGIAGFCLIAILGLIPTGLNSNQAAIAQTAANSILSSVAADLRGTAKKSNKTSQYAIDVPAAGVAGSKTLYFNENLQSVATAAAGRYRLTITFLTAATGGMATSATCADLNVTWPSAVDPATAKPAGSARVFVAADRN